MTEPFANGYPQFGRCRIFRQSHSIIEKIQHVRSHELDLLQLCDLFIGAIAYNLNQTEKASEAKVRFIEKLKIRTRTYLESTTSKRISKFNLFRIQI